MANPFDRFDEAPAPGPAAPPPGGNPFDRFDEPAQPARAKMGAAEAAVRGAESGAMFGFNDELHGMQAASGLPEIVQRAVPLVSGSLGAARRVAEAVAPSVFGTGAGERYDERVGQEREAGRRAGEDQPLAHFGGELAGGLATAAAGPVVAPFKAAQSAGLLAKAGAATGNLAAGGAAYGAVSGAGAGEGDVIDRLPAAGQGAAIGAALGPAAGALIHGGAAGARFVADNARALRDPAALADRVIGRAVRQDGADLGEAAARMEAANVVPRPAQLIRPDGSVDELPASYFVQGGIVREAGPNGAPGAALGRYQEAGQEIGGQRVVLADLAGDNTRGVAGNVARMPGEGRTPARRFLEDRQVGTETAPGQSDRISDRVSGLLGDRGAIETADEIMARRAANARPAYERAHAVRLDYDSSEGQRLLGLLDRIPQEARNEANRILRISDREGSQAIWQPGPDGGYQLAAVPNSRQFDYIKRGLDTLIDRNSNPVTGELNTLGGAIVGLKNEILGSLDKLNPAYATARRQFAGETELLDALRLGQTVLLPKMTPEAVRKAVAGLSEGEADMFRLGAANAIRERLANAPDTADKVRMAYGSPAIRAKIAAIVPDKAARDTFHGYIRNEAAMAQTRAKATGGSPTAERLADEGAMDGVISGAATAAVQAGTGHVRAAMRTAFDTMRQVSPEMRGRVMNAARKVLYDPNPEAVRDFMARLDAAEMRDGTRQRVLSAVTQALPRGLLAPATGQ